MIKKVIAAVLVGILTLSFSFSVYAGFNIHDSNLPFPPVGDQKTFPDCWSYAAMGAVSYSMVMKDNADFSKEENRFSEWHMAAAMNTAQEAFFKRYTRSHEEGGNRAGAVAYLSRSFASGPVVYKDYNENAYRLYLSDKSQYKLLTLKKKQATLTKAQFLTGRDEGSSYAKYDAKTKTVTYGKNNEVIEKIKNAVKEYGAVAVSYYSYERDKKSYFNPSSAAYCVPWEDYINKKTPDGNCVRFSENGYRFERASNHAAIIVGWDDSYSYENFKDTPMSFDSEGYTPENGAWIVKNSWGTNFGNDGFEYVSYMEPTICQYATVYDMEHTQKYNAVTYTQKGLMGSVRFPSVGYGVCAVNRFNQKGLINAVGIYVCDKRPTVEILIDTSPEEELKKFTKAQFERGRETLIDMETGQELTSLRFENEGYYMLCLKEPVYSEGTVDVYVKYSVDEKGDVILPTGNNIGTEEEYTPSVTYWAHITGNGHVHEWKGIDVNWCVNMFTTEAAFERVKSEREGDKLTLKLIRYKKDAQCRVMAAFYKDDEIIKRKSYTPEFDKYGVWQITEKIDGATRVKAITWY